MTIRLAPCAAMVCAGFMLSAIGQAVAHDVGNAHVPIEAGVKDPPASNACAVAPATPESQGEPAPRGRIQKVSARFPNIVLRTQCDTPVLFYDDLVKDRIVLINFMYTTCSDICPGTTQNLVYVYEALGERVGRDILMLSISIDPKTDTPGMLKAYDEIFGGPRPGWLYLTGDYDQIDFLRRTLGVYDLDPVIDADKTQHSGILTFGNDRTNRWAALPALANYRELARTILRITRDTRRKRRKLSSLN